ncbi:hypothetical protein OH687_38635 (plasmid) [Burkholderia anthina]|nr:hypothetical protein OH687_38635 [Burkholderia anthina]
MGYINPLLQLPAAHDLLALPIESRHAVASVLRALRTQANAQAEIAWSRRKGPMAAYWRAVATYARHLAHAVDNGRSGPKSGAATCPYPPRKFDAGRRADAPRGSNAGSVRAAEAESNADQS